MAVQRRTIWLADTDWDRLKELAAKEGINPSIWIWARIVDFEEPPKPTQAQVFQRAFRPAPKPGKH